MLRTLSWIRCVSDTLVTDTHVDSIYISWLSHHLAPRIVSRVEKLGVKLWQLASRRRLLRNRLPVRCFLRGPKWRLSLSTTFVSGYGAMAGRLWVTFGTFQPCVRRFPSFWALQEAPGWQASCNKHRRKASSILIFGTSTFYDGIEALALRMDKCLNVNYDSVEVWCVPSATRHHVLIEVRMKFSVSHGVLFF